MQRGSKNQKGKSKDVSGIQLEKNHAVVFNFQSKHSTVNHHLPQIWRESHLWRTLNTSLKTWSASPGNVQVCLREKCRLYNGLWMLMMKLSHFTDNQALKKERTAKLQPLQNHLNKIYHVLPFGSTYTTWQSSDRIFWLAQIQTAFRISLRFGSKVWCLNSPLGYLVNFLCISRNSLQVEQSLWRNVWKSWGTLILFEKLPRQRYTSKVLLRQLPSQVYL